MMAEASFEDYDSSFSRFIAEALIARDGPQEISVRAELLGLSPEAKQVAVAACVATACDSTDQVQHLAFSARR